jgi:adenine deaminase
MSRLIRHATLVNVYSGELLPGNVAIAGGSITYVGPREPPAAEVIDARGMYLAPAWIEPHAHPWLLYNPVSMIEGVLPGGTTTIFKMTCSSTCRPARRTSPACSTRWPGCPSATAG